MNFDLESGLTLHFILMVLVFGSSLIILIKRKEVDFLSAGFWAWISFFLVYVTAPICSLGSDGELLLMNIFSQGIPYAYLLKASIVTTFGLLIFWISYFYKPAQFPKSLVGLSNRDIHKSKLSHYVFIIILLLLAGYSQIKFGGSPLREGSDWQMSSDEIGHGYFSGDVTGYGVNLYRSTIPVVIYLFFGKWKFVSIVLAGLFVFLRMYSVWSRHAIIMMLLGISFCYFWEERGRVTKIMKFMLIFVCFISALLLQARGHYSLGDTTWEELWYLTRETGVKEAIGSAENQMFFISVATMCLDDNNGYNLGSNLVKQTIVSPVPRKIAPNLKSRLEDYLNIHLFGRGRGERIIPAIMNCYPGFIGSFYSMGSWIGVALGMFLTGRGVRLLQKMVGKGVLPVTAMIGISIVSMFPILLRHQIEGFPFYFGLQVVPLLILIRLGTKRVWKRNSLSKGNMYGLDSGLAELTKLTK